MAIKKRGVSEVVTTVIMIGLVLVAASIIWGVASSMIQRNVQQSENCAGIYDKVVIYKRATCYNEASDEFFFFVETKDINVTKLIVSISGDTYSQSIEIPSGGYSFIKEVEESYGDALRQIGSNDGQRYVFDVSTIPKMITVAPVVKGTQCPISDTVKNIGNC
jgi:flagellin-like protein